MKVDFIFEIDQLVKVTATEEIGVVTTACLDDGGKRYYVQGKGEGKWWAERLLVPASD